MRRLALCVLAVTAGLLLSGAPVAAAPDTALNRQTSGPFSGTSVFDSTAACSIHQVFDATYTVANGRSGSFHLDGCVGSALAYSGVFVVTTPNGAIVNGTVAGFIGGGGVPQACDPTHTRAPLNFTLTLAHGTKSFQHATGTIHLIGTWCSPNAAGVPGPIVGTLTGALGG
jgi:hypothetical protein